MFKFLKFNRRNNRQKNTKKEFEFLMEKARKIKGNQEALYDLIKIIMRPIQDLHIRDAYLKADHEAIERLDFFKDWFEHNPSFTWANFKSDKNQDEKLILHLATDIVLPTCWHPFSLINNLGMIGSETRKCGKFKQNLNHSVILLLPMRIGFVTGGNHSIMQGIIMGDGTLTPNEIIDATEILPQVSFDGENWKDCDGKHIGKPRYPEFGWVWEIAKLLPESK